MPVLLNRVFQNLLLQKKEEIMSEPQPKFKILAADKLAEEGLEWIQSQPDAQLVNKPGLSEEELAAEIGQYDAIIVRSGVTVTANVLENTGRLKVIARAGVGVDNIDIPTATKKGILVVNTAAASTTTTAEHAFALMLSMARKIGPAYKTVSNGGWDRSKFKGRQLAGKTLAIVGFGRIGHAIAQRALGFDMDVIAYDPFINSDTEMDGKVKMYQSFTDLLPYADVMTFHVPLNDKTRGMLNSDTFKLCKKDLMVINASRGGVIDEEDLVVALDEGIIAAAALDVYANEPPAGDSPIRTHEKILCTPHLGASTQEAQTAVSVDAAASVLAYLRGEGIKGAVNASGLRMDLSATQSRFLDLAQRMAKLIDPMVEGIRKVEFEVFGKELFSAEQMIQREALVSLLAPHLSDPVNVVNVNHIAQQRGIEFHVTENEKDKYGSSLTICVTDANGRQFNIVGRVYDDHQPRIVEINDYRMDMIPAGHMVIIQNQDKAGTIGFVGSEFGQANVNIADMSISRRDDTALMVIKTDGHADDQLLKKLRDREGILKVAAVDLD